MGQSRSSLDVNLIYKTRVGEWKRNEAPVVFELKDLGYAIHADRRGVNVGKIGTNIEGESHTLTFKSHARDFEVIPSQNNLTIARGQCIGVIIDFTRDIYIKLWKDKETEHGFSLYTTHWAHTSSNGASEDKIGTDQDPTVGIIHSDLSIGYDVYIIDYTGKGKHWCEPRTEADSRETPILFSEFQKYANYTD
jgi:hypothetical protein